MRYCEQYVITCGIEVWRGSETARVEYRKGEISGVTVGGIDAPERLAEVMQWASGNYRLIVPRLTLPEGHARAKRRAGGRAPRRPARRRRPAAASPAARPGRRRRRRRRRPQRRARRTPATTNDLRNAGRWTWRP